MPHWNLEAILPMELGSFLMSPDFVLSKAAFAAALLVLLIIVRKSRPRQRVIFNF